MSQEVANETRFMQGAQWLNDHWPQLWPTLLNVAGIVSLGLFPAGLGLLIPAVLLASANIKLILQTPASRRLEQRLRRLERDLEDANEAYYSLYEEYLSSLSELLDNKLIALYRDTLALSASERVTVYRHRNGTFLLAARYSRHPEYTKAGRDMYPDDQGCLAQAWRNGSAFVDDLPDPSADAADYVQQQLHWGLDEETLQQMRMKSRIEPPSLIEEDQKLLDFVIDTTRNKSWDDFIRLVYSTYPIMTQQRDQRLDLVTLAGKYNAQKKAEAEQ